MAAMQWGIPTEHARRKCKKKLYWASQELHKRFQDWDGSLWIKMETEHLKDVEMLDLLYNNYSKYHPYVMKEETEIQILRRIKCLIEESADQAGRQRVLAAMAQFNHNIQDELPARVPEEEDVISSGSGDEEWEAGIDTTTK